MNSFFFFEIDEIVKYNALGIDDTNIIPIETVHKLPCEEILVPFAELDE